MWLWFQKKKIVPSLHQTLLSFLHYNFSHKFKFFLKIIFFCDHSELWHTIDVSLLIATLFLPDLTFFDWIHHWSLGTIKITCKITHITEWAEYTELCRWMYASGDSHFHWFGTINGTPCLSGYNKITKLRFFFCDSKL